jgi:N-acetylmuramoyl-L-alanine amidase
VKTSFLRKKWKHAVGGVSRNALPCVGIVVLGGCLTFLIAPDELPPLPGAHAGQGLPLVIIDAGHGGRDAGGRSNGIIEKEMTLDLANRTERLLKIAGFPTTMTRREDVYVSLEQRARIANESEHALFVSIHLNKDGASSSTGIESFYAKEKVPPGDDWTWVGFFSRNNDDENVALGEHLAGAVQACLATRTEARNRGIRARDLYVVRHTRVPAVLVEVGFMSNEFDAILLKSEDYRERIAMGIAEGIMTFQKSRPQSPEASPQVAQVSR